MPLSPPAPRRHIHTRRIECRGYLREDGLWDVDAWIEDTKTYPFESELRGTVEAGGQVHVPETRPEHLPPTFHPYNPHTPHTITPFTRVPPHPKPKTP